MPRPSLLDAELDTYLEPLGFAAPEPLKTAKPAAPKAPQPAKTIEDTRKRRDEIRAELLADPTRKKLRPEQLDQQIIDRLKREGYPTTFEVP